MSNNLKIDDIKNIVKDYGQMVSALCNRMTRNSELAKEAAQESWYEIIKSIDSFKNSSKISTWIYSITYRTVFKYINKEKICTEECIIEYIETQEQFVCPPEDQFLKEEWIRNTCNKCLTGFLYCLNHNDRFIYILRDIAEIEYREIEKINGISYTTVRKSISRSRNKLKNFLNDNCILANPAADCRCKIKKYVQEIKLEKEFAKIKKSLDKISTYSIAEDIFNKINYWKNLS